MKNNYDPIANNYDWLSRIFFQRKLILSQTCVLPQIPVNSSILIVGGGSGWILEEIAKIQPAGLSITYVEISKKMIRKAQERDVRQNEVLFVNEAIEDFTAHELFDVVFTAYLFDNFGAQRVEMVFNKLNGLLKEDGKWLFVDFHIDETKSPWWQKWWMKTMLFFFGIICDIEARQPLPTEALFTKKGFIEFYQYTHMQNFLKSIVYIRSSTVPKASP